MLGRILIAVAGLAGALATLVARRPSQFSVVRSTTVSAPPASVFAHIDDFHKWEAWSPWAKVDPAMRQTYEGAPAGTGAVYRWAGNRQVGEGSMTITESDPGKLVRIQLEFTRPFRASNTTEFLFEPLGDGTLLTWSMSGTNNFIAKTVHLFMDMDKMVGGQFEKGLADLKTVAEAAAKH
jgi:hypothetical protein